MSSSNCDFVENDVTQMLTSCDIVVVVKLSTSCDVVVDVVVKCDVDFNCAVVVNFVEELKCRRQCVRHVSSTSLDVENQKY